MATFKSTTFLKYDDYMTPKIAFEYIKDYIPKDKLIWEAFYGDGMSGEYLKELGFNVIHKPIDFFENNLGDIIVSNPPFSKAKSIIERLKILNKPFILILPVSKISTSYFKNLYGNDRDLKLLIPPKRLHFTKKINGEIPKNWGNRCNFECFYYCYKIDTIKETITWL
jgi:hypothetical protein